MLRAALAQRFSTDPSLWAQALRHHDSRLPRAVLVDFAALNGVAIDRQAIVDAVIAALHDVPALERVFISRLQMTTALVLSGDHDQLALVIHRSALRGGLVLSGATLERLVVQKSTLRSLRAKHFSAVHDVRLSETTIDRAIDLEGASIGSNLRIEGARLWRAGPEGDVAPGAHNAALYAPGARVGGNFVIGPYVQIRNHVILDGLSVRRKCVFCGFTLRGASSNGRAGGGRILRGHGLSVGEVMLIGSPKGIAERYSDFLVGQPPRAGDQSERTRVHGAVDFRASKFGGDLWMRGLEVASRDLNLSPEADGVARLKRMRKACADPMRLSVDGVEEVAVSLQGAEIAGRLDFTGGARFSGSLIATNAQIGSDVLGDGAHITTLSNTAIGLGGTRIGGSVLIGRLDRRRPTKAAHRTVVTGGIRLKYASVAEDVNLAGLQFVSGGGETGVDVRYARIGGGLIVPALPAIEPSFAHLAKAHRLRFDNAEAKAFAFDDGMPEHPRVKVSLVGFRYAIKDLNIYRVRFLHDVCKRVHGARDTFAPQPFEHLARLAREAGFAGEAKRILYSREKVRMAVSAEANKTVVLKRMQNALRQRDRLITRIRRGVILDPAQTDPNPVTRTLSRAAGHVRSWIQGQWAYVRLGMRFLVYDRIVGIFPWVFRALGGFGYVPERLAFALLAVFAVISSGLWLLGGDALFIPVKEGSIADYVSNGRLPPGYPVFRIWLYVLDLLVPVFDFGISGHWTLSAARGAERWALNIAEVLVFAGRVVGLIITTVLVFVIRERFLKS
ncbi:MAG: hypothetical protein AAFQ88_09815 [Pseudomonadota bacterium]